MTALPDAREPMAEASADEAFAAILDGHVEAEPIATFLVQMAERGETATEIASAARAMRARMRTIAAPAGAIDVCGTGGDGQNSLNVSTATALVVAACDVPVAKHGNRAASSKAGAADTLEALGLDLDRAAADPERSLAEMNIAFLFAPQYHPALAPLAPIRRVLGRRTIFNLLGPLCNPARVERQLIGVATPELVPVYAEAAGQLGTGRTMVVSGNEGLDELSVSGPSTVATIESGEVTLSEIAPDDAGIASHPLSEIAGGDAAFNAERLRALFRGEPSAYREAVLLNAAAALVVAGEATSLADGAEEAAEAIDKGLANALLDCWIANP